MPDVTLSPSLAALSALAPLLGAAFAAGSLTQLARQLAGDQPPRALRTAALAVAAGIAALTVVALLSVTLPPEPAPAALLAAACITGWSGPGILARLGSLVERRLGLSAVGELPVAPTTDAGVGTQALPQTPPPPAAQNEP